MLEVSDKREGGVAFACMTCPFLFKVEKTVSVLSLSTIELLDEIQRDRQNKEGGRCGDSGCANEYHV